LDQSKAFLWSFVLALVAMGLVYLWVSDREQELKQVFGADQKIIVAARNINSFEEIAEDSFKFVTMPKKFIQPGAQKSKDAIIGLVANSPISKGEQILNNKLISKGAETGLASQVAVSRRAFSVPVSDVTGVTKLLIPGDRVDIISAIPYQTEEGQRSEVKTVMQNVHVLATGQNIQNQIPQIMKTDPVTKRVNAIDLRGGNYNTVTIEVRPQDAQSLIYVLQAGAELFMTLRNPVDRSVSEVATSDVDDVLGPESKKAVEERLKKEALLRKKRVPARVQVVKPKPKPKPLPKPKPNPWQSGGGDFVP